jgi:hypothetical protein
MISGKRSDVLKGSVAVSRGRSADSAQKSEPDILVSEDQGDTWERQLRDVPLPALSRLPPIPDMIRLPNQHLKTT